MQRSRLQGADREVTERDRPASFRAVEDELGHNFRSHRDGQENAVAGHGVIADVEAHVIGHAVGLIRTFDRLYRPDRPVCMLLRSDAGLRQIRVSSRLMREFRPTTVRECSRSWRFFRRPAFVGVIRPSWSKGPAPWLHAGHSDRRPPRWSPRTNSRPVLTGPGAESKRPRAGSPPRRVRTTHSRPA